MTRKDHPTAETVYSHVREEFPNISLGTVYRNLSFLVENGQAVKVSCNDGSVHFDGNTAPHYHFQCRKCGAILDMEMQSLPIENVLFDEASKNFNGIIEGNITYFYGICPDCMNK
jgi:Fur family peroxide stress response transcriptional regulator